MQNTWNEKIEEVLSVGLPLSGFGINNWGLTKEKALIAIQQLNELSIPILGGDVLKFENERWIHTYDNWYCNQNFGESKEEFAIRSNQVAFQYINNYRHKEGDVLFVLVPKD